MDVIPSLDILDGKVVRLRRGDYSQVEVFDISPRDFAVRIQQAGMRRLHLVDLEGARSGRCSLAPLVRELRSATDLVIDVGGGIRTRQHVESIFESGARIASIGSAAIETPEEVEQWLADFGADRFLLFCDVRNGMVSTRGWRADTEVQATDFVTQWHPLGVSIAATDISRDGMGTGPGLELYRRLLEAAHGIRLVASGGVHSKIHLQELRSTGLSGCIIGKALLSGALTLEDCA